MAKVTATLDLNAAAFQRGIKSATAALGQLGSTIAGIGTGAALGGLAAAAAGVAVSMAGMKKALDLGGELADMSARTGIAVSQLVVLRQAFANAGLSAEDVGTAVARMQKALAGVNEDGDETTSVFQKLGLDMDKLRGMAPDEQFQAVGRALASIQDPATRTATAMQIFGRSGANLLSVFRDVSAISNARAEVGGLADVMNKNANLFDTISDRIKTAFEVKPMQLFAAMAEEFAPKIEAISKTIAELDFSGIGKGISAELTAAFEGGSIAGGIATLGGKIVTVLGTAVGSLGDVVFAILTKAFEEPIISAQQKIEQVTALIASRFSDSEGDQAMNQASDLESQNQDLRARIEELRQRAPGSGSTGLFGMSTEMSPEAYAQDLAELESRIKKNTEERNRLFDVANAKGSPVFDGISAARPEEARVGFGDGKTAPQRIEDAAKRVNESVASQFPSRGAGGGYGLSPGSGLLRPNSPIYNRQGVEGATPFFKSPFAPGAGLGGIAGTFQKQLADLLGGNRSRFNFDQNEGRKRTQIMQSELQKQTAIIKAALATPRVIQVQPVLA